MNTRGLKSTSSVTLQLPAKYAMAGSTIRPEEATNMTAVVQRADFEGSVHSSP